MQVKIWELRTAKGYSLRQLEKISGVSKTDINDIENNRISPTLDTLEMLAKALNVKLIELIKL